MEAQLPLSSLPQPTASTGICKEVLRNQSCNCVHARGNLLWQNWDFWVPFSILTRLTMIIRLFWIASTPALNIFLFLRQKEMNGSQYPVNRTSGRREKTTLYTNLTHNRRGGKSQEKMDQWIFLCISHLFIMLCYKAIPLASKNVVISVWNFII